jgi:hypothetical protein
VRQGGHVAADIVTASLWHAISSTVSAARNESGSFQKAGSSRIERASLALHCVDAAAQPWWWAVCPVYARSAPRRSRLWRLPQGWSARTRLRSDLPRIAHCSTDRPRVTAHACAAQRCTRAHEACVPRLATRDFAQLLEVGVAEWVSTVIQPTMAELRQARRQIERLLAPEHRFDLIAKPGLRRRCRPTAVPQRTSRCHPIACTVQAGTG